MIDPWFDFRQDCPGRDPDSYSPRLRSAHQFLWSKALPSGAVFDITERKPAAYLYHKSGLGEFYLASDAIIATYEGRESPEILDTVPREEREEFERLGSSLGGRILFPGVRIDGKMTINGARGCHRRIADRFDLTLECIRRFYVGQDNPLDATLRRNRSFFALFGNFRGFIDFFLLEDMVSSDLEVQFFLPFDDFRTSPVPVTGAAYRQFRDMSLEFVEGRNQRMRRWIGANRR